MKRLLIMLFSIFLPFFASAEPIQWTYESGGNGHWYEFVEEPVGWFAANNFAASRTHEGYAGHLATATIATEEAWFVQEFALGFPVWLGAHIESDESGYFWYWVTGEAFEYSNWIDWDGSGGPTSFGLCLTDNGWNPENHIVNQFSYIVEYPNSDLFMDTSVVLSDVPADQGGYLNVSWLRSNLDAPALPDSITIYHAQRFEFGSWENLISIAATHADSYQVTVPTLDVLTIGEPEPFSVYRVVASSSDPTQFYLSAVDSAYSVDNIAPPQPNAWLIESDDYRFVVCSDPEIPDLGEVCIFRGNYSGFLPEDPVHCSSDFVFNEPSQVVNAYYRVQFSDIHGNLSEFSAEVTLSNPSGVDDLFPQVFGMEQNFPNPFNPSTTIKFRLPESEIVSLKVFDVSGNLVRNLIAGQIMAGGYQEKTWNGKDDRGQVVSAGLYFYQLNAGEFSETKRMLLVK